MDTEPSGREQSTLDAEESREGPLRPLLVAFLLLVVIGGIVDLSLDEPATWWSWHVVFEVGMIVASLAFATSLFVGWQRTAGRLGAARDSLAAASEALAQRQLERDQWRASAEHALQGFSRAIDRQFDLWHLTPAERAVALLLLKGEGHKQAAAALGRSERTVRQHAVEVYRKAGLQGRAELAAFFLHDLTLPERDLPNP